MRGRLWARAGLVIVLVFNVWWRCHTVGPALRDRLGVSLWPVNGTESEPLDCDEAIYAHIGKRITGGAVMYRDLTENKPPLGYWLYALAVALGGSNELTIRLMPVPAVLGVIGLVWWIGLRLRGPVAAVLAAMTYAVLSTDPFLYGNGCQLEQIINLFSTASLALLIAAWDRPGRGLIFASGLCLGAAALVKQVAALNGSVFVLALLLRKSSGSSGRLRDVGSLLLGFASVCGIAALIVVTQGAGREAFDDIFRYGPALATDIPRDPLAPPLVVRWFTGNGDPGGQLPPPFGRSEYLVWWGWGSWPVWLAAVPATAWLLLASPACGRRRLLAAWTLSAWVQVALPRLFWPHYYLLPVPGLAISVAVLLCDLTSLARARRVAPALGAVAIGSALIWTGWVQTVEYLRVAPEELTVRDKGGRQWLILRALGREIGARSKIWPRPTIFVWGWQSPLFFYSGLDGVTRQVFADDLIKTFAGGGHPLVRTRLERTMRELKANPPSLILAGYPPFPELRSFLNERYLPSGLSQTSPDGRGLWVERGKYGEFETLSPPIKAAVRRAPRPSPPPSGSGRAGLP